MAYEEQTMTFSGQNVLVTGASLMNTLLEQLRNSSTHLVLNNALPSGKLRVDFDDLQFSKRYRMWNSFFQTKLYLLLASLELAKRPEGRDVRIVMAVPGTFKSRLVREAPWPVGWVKNLFSADVDDAAANILYVAQSDEERAATGKVFNKREEVPLATYWQDQDIRKRLWTETETILESNKND
jgi:NAD(P)-dependent dehydrogenase (short-subunit alcohol dehydrogenase family)